MTMAFARPSGTTPVLRPQERAAARRRRRNILATTAALALHAAPALLLLRSIPTVPSVIEPQAITVELIRLDAAPPRPPSDRAPGEEKVRSAQTRPAAQTPPRRVVVAAAPEALPVQPIQPRTAEAPSPQPPAPATTAPPARPAPPAVQASSAPQEWRARLLAHLDRHKRYPAVAERQRQEGVVHIRFTMNREGRVLTSSVTRGSGRPMLDREALAMLQRAQPLPTPPADEPGDVIEIATHVDFFTRR